MIRKIIEFETKNSINTYELKGLKTKYEIYCLSISNTINEHLKRKLTLAVKKTKDEKWNVLNFMDKNNNFDILYKASQLLYKNLHEFISPEFKAEIEAFGIFTNYYPSRNTSFTFSTIIEWKDGSLKSDFKKQLSANIKSKKKIEIIIENIDNMINERLKYLE